MQTVMIGEEVEFMRPIWREFILDLGYSPEQAEKFVDGYVDALEKLPILGKVDALSRQHPECMTSGFKSAGICEKEALESSQRSERGS